MILLWGYQLTPAISAFGAGGNLVKPLTDHCVNLAAIHCTRQRASDLDVDSASLASLRRQFSKASYDDLKKVKPLINTFKTSEKLSDAARDRIAKVFYDAEDFRKNSQIPDKIFVAKIFTGDQILALLQQINAARLQLEKLNWQDWSEDIFKTDDVSHPSQSIYNKYRNQLAQRSGFNSLAPFWVDQFIFALFLDNCQKLGFHPELLLLWGALEGFYRTSTGSSFAYSLIQGFRDRRQEWQKFASFVETHENQQDQSSTLLGFYSVDSVINRDLVNIVNLTGLESVTLTEKLIMQSETDRNLGERVKRMFLSSAKEQSAPTRTTFVYKKNRDGESYLYFVITSQKMQSSHTPPATEEEKEEAFESLPGLIPASNFMKIKNLFCPVVAKFCRRTSLAEDGF